jgi:hypothetical protein
MLVVADTSAVLAMAACDGAIQGEDVEAVVEPRTSRPGESEIAA